MAGLSFRLAGHPFEYNHIMLSLSTIKVRMQMKSEKVPFYRAALEILKKEGVIQASKLISLDLFIKECFLLY